MALPINRGYKPMEAKSAPELPTGNHWQYEPKWDGFRCIAFRDGEKIELQSKAGRSLTRYFPDIAHGLKSLEARRFVIDGELVISVDGTLSFEQLLARMNPSSKRVTELARKQPSVFLIFDILVADDGELLVSLPLKDRRGPVRSIRGYLPAQFASCSTHACNDRPQCCAGMVQSRRRIA